MKLTPDAQAYLGPVMGAFLAMRGVSNETIQAAYNTDSLVMLVDQELASCEVEREAELALCSDSNINDFFFAATDK